MRKSAGSKILTAFLVAIAGSSCSGTAIPRGANSSSTALGVAELIDSRQNFDGQTVILQGFLTRQDGFYFLYQGWKRADQSSTLQYSCASTKVAQVYFSDKDLNRKSKYKYSYRIPDGYLTGRRVLLIGRFRKQIAIPVREFVIEDFKARDLASASLGYLKDVSIIEIFRDSC